MPSEASLRIRATFADPRTSAAVPLETGRRSWEETARQAVLPANTTIEAQHIAGIACEWVRCGPVDADAVLLFFHGGGYTSGSCVTHRELAVRLSLVCGLPVLLPAYRLAPEHPFPAGLDDAVAVYQSLIQSHKRIILAGDSAGGGLALAAALRLRDAGGPASPLAVILLSAWLDLTFTGESMQTRVHLEPTVSETELRAAAQLYCGDQPPTHPLISPVLADLTGLPPLLIQVGDHEILLSDSTRLAERAEAAGVDVRLDIWPDMWHVWHSWAADLPEGQQAIDDIGAYVRQKRGR